MTKRHPSIPPKADKLLRKLARIFERFDDRPLPDVGFNMKHVNMLASRDTPDFSGHLCKTVCCISGWAFRLDNVHSGIDKAFGWPKVRDPRVRELIYAPDTLQDCTPKEAARMLRHLLRTGVVDWTVARVRS